MEKENKKEEIYIGQNEMSDIGAFGEDVEEELVEISSSLAKQICEELESGLENQQNQNHKKVKKQKFVFVQGAVILILVILVSAAFFLGLTEQGNNFLLKMGIDASGKMWDSMTGDFEENPELQEEPDDQDDVTDAEEVDTENIIWPDVPGEGRKEEYAINVLLLGEEAIGSGSGRGRTDVMLIATMNTKTNEIKLTSLMRDMLVRIPGHKENKLNAAYARGGIELLYETIALNFDIHLDGSVMVNFENFEKIIDSLGGLEVTLTESESKYLNRTNYISNPQYRTTTVGPQVLNGNQALGYARIRDRAAITGNKDDYGRTDRHRIILDAIFEKYKTKSKVELLGIMYNLLPMISTDINSDTFKYMLNTFVDMGTMEIQQLRIPADGMFRQNVSVRGMDVIIPDYNENIRTLHEFVFAE